MDNFNELITKKSKEWGATFIGFSNVRECLDEIYHPYTNCITIGVRLSDAIIDQIENMPTYTYFQHYRTANFLLDQITMKITLLIMENGSRALAVPASQTVHNVKMKHSGIFQHKTGATKAGLGFIGKSGMFISKDFGPRVRLATVLTDLPIEFNELNTGNEGLDKESLDKFGLDKEGSNLNCGSCRKCVDSCPAGAIVGNNYFEGIERDLLVDAKKCSDYMNKNFKDIGRGSVCGVCIKVCPFGTKY